MQIPQLELGTRISNWAVPSDSIPRNRDEGFWRPPAPPTCGREAAATPTGCGQSVRPVCITVECGAPTCSPGAEKAIVGAKLALVALGTVALLVAAGGCSAAPASDTLPTTTPSPAPLFQPAANSLSGRVVQVIPGGVIIDSAGRQVEVSLSQATEIWKETSVLSSAIEVGDDLSINGTQGTPFEAQYVWANIGRIDGVIKQIGNADMLIEVSVRSGGTTLERAEFSPYIAFGAGGAKMTRADLYVGRAVSAVVYRPRGGTLRITRIW